MKRFLYILAVYDPVDQVIGFTHTEVNAGSEDAAYRAGSHAALIDGRLPVTSRERANDYVIELPTVPRRRLEPLEDAEARCDAVMLDPTAAYEQKRDAVARLLRRGYQDPAVAERAIAELTPDKISELTRQHEAHAARG